MGHLKPFLIELKRSQAQFSTPHFMSNGPVTQYKGRGNIHLMANIQFDLGYKEVFWNFSEAVHGKGPADGMGANIKTSRQHDSFRQ